MVKLTDVAIAHKSKQYHFLKSLRHILENRKTAGCDMY
jgi:hypothetical protein